MLFSFSFSFPFSFSQVEIAAGIAIGGSILAVAVPTFVKNVHASHLVEAVEGVEQIQRASLAYATEKNELPQSAPLTPPAVPRGARAADPPGVWDHPTWVGLSFRAVPDGVPHAYAFEIESQRDEIVARAHGDLDGDGVLSTFETRVRAKPSGGGFEAVPGMYTEAELE